MTKGQEASTLVLVLGIVTLILVLGAWSLTSKVSRRGALNQELLSAQANALARAGLEDAYAKLSKDYKFPPSGALTQETFSYTQALEFQPGEEAGIFEVSLDRTLDTAPKYLIRIRSTGTVGPARAPRARRTLYAEWDSARLVRARPWHMPTPNPDLGKWVYFEKRSQ